MSRVRVLTAAALAGVLTWAVAGCGGDLVAGPVAQPGPPAAGGEPAGAASGGASPATSVGSSSGSSAGGRPGGAPGRRPPGPGGSRPPSQPPGQPPSRLAVLQLNLCNSGFALDCYTGGAAVTEAAQVIARTRPDVVTLNEICRHDLDRLAAALPHPDPFQVFQPAYNHDGTPFPCRNGDQFGNGIVGHGGEPVVRGGRYPMQVGGNDEDRSWACAGLPAYAVCVTHLTSYVRETALQQCRYLLGTGIPAALSAFGGRRATVLSGDLNLPAGGSPSGGPSAQDCVPAGWSRTGDDVQHTLAAGLGFAGAERVPMSQTDHPGWLVTLRPR